MRARGRSTAGHPGKGARDQCWPADKPRDAEQEMEFNETSGVCAMESRLTASAFDGLRRWLTDGWSPTRRFHCGAHFGRRSTLVERFRRWAGAVTGRRNGSCCVCVAKCPGRHVFGCSYRQSLSVQPGRGTTVADWVPGNRQRWIVADLRLCDVLVFRSIRRIHLRSTGNLPVGPAGLLRWSDLAGRRANRT
jgi:hypothetical protein